MSDPFTQGKLPSEYDSPDQHLRTPKPPGDDWPSLTARECLELVQEVVDVARHESKQKLGHAGDGAKPLKLTVDLNEKRIAHLPNEAVAHIKPDVERLQLSHNQLRDLPLDFASCLSLKYLNLRYNKFTEIPLVIFRLQQLEILDVSRNHLTFLPKEIERLKNLRVFGFKDNRIQELPLCLGNISTLRMLKVRGNPLGSDILEVIRRHDESLPPATPGLIHENEKDISLTEQLVSYLRDMQSLNEDASDGPLETPRAASRFQLHPSDSGYLTSGSESASGSRSPGLTRSTRSHYRGASSQYNTSLSSVARRPGLAPLALSNDRNRSNSESVQAAQNTRNKRMGIVTKKPKELNILEEATPQRNSFHLRGQSHNSALKNVRPGEDSPSEENGRNHGQTSTLVRRLSSVPERKQDNKIYDEIIECAKGVLYSLHSVQTPLTSLANLVKDSTSKRSSLEKYHHQASVQLEDLDQSLQDLSLPSNKSRNAQASARKKVCRATHASIDMYGQIAGILLQNINELVVGGDLKYLRTLMLLLYGSINEQRNARRKLSARTNHQQSALRTIPSTVSLSSQRIVNRDDALTPTQDDHRPGRQRTNGQQMQQPLSQANLASVMNSQHSAPPSTFSSRATSRSSSRAGYYYPSLGSSAINTPRSGESFSSSLYNARSRAGSVSAAANAERVRQAQTEQVLFERIFHLLERAAEQGLSTIHHLEPKFQATLDASRRQWGPMDTSLWETIAKRAQRCNAMSQSLRLRLHSMNIDDIEARNASDFWSLVKRFGAAYGDLFLSLKQAKKLDQLEPALRHKLSPTHKLVREVITLIQNSPWNKLSTPSQPASMISSRAPTPVQNGYPRPSMQHQMLPPKIPNPSMAAHQHYQHRRPNGSTGSNGSLKDNTKSPYNTSVPATPLSAALGPAAQATIPSTPASAGGSLAGMFEGDVFQRADQLLQGQQTMFRRPAGAP